MKGLRLVDTFDDKGDAEAAMFAYAEMLRDRGDVERYGVFVERIATTGVFGVYLLDRQYAPTRAAARRKGR